MTTADGQQRPLNVELISLYRSPSQKWLGLSTVLWSLSHCRMTLDGSVATSLTAALVGYGLRCQFSSGDEGNATFRDEVRIAENYQSVYGLVMEEMVRCPFEIFSPRPIGRMDTRTRKGEIRIGEYTSFSVLVLVEAIDDQITRVEYFVYYSSLGYESYMKKLDAYLKNGKQMCK